MTVHEGRERLSIVIAGHVDHGKSTIIGRLLAETGSLPQGKLEQVRAFCARHSKPFEYAFLLDALKDEQSQGITIDAARIFFRTTLRDYLIIDAPGHIEFLKNMISGASHASAALLVIDAHEGVRENSRRHGYMLAMLGIRQIVVLVNKMDLVGYQETVFRRICDEYGGFLGEVGMTPSAFLPVSGFEGENIAGPPARMPWFAGPSVLAGLDGFVGEASRDAKPLRLPVQDVYRFTALGDDRRIVAGSVETGTLRPGDEIVFLPSGKSTAVASLEAFPAAPAAPASAGQAIGLTLREQVYVRRGELVARQDEPRPHVATRFEASLFWLGRAPLVAGKPYLLKLGTARAQAQVAAVTRVLDASSLALQADKGQVDRHEVAECVLALDRPLAFDTAEDNFRTGRFVLVDDFEISGGGLIRGPLADEQSWVREKVILRNTKWQTGLITAPQRESRYNQRPALLLITGSDDACRKAVARWLEADLFGRGRFVYFLGIGSVLYGVDADLREGRMDHAEDIRRLAEVANILLDSGLILIVTAARLTRADHDIILTAVDASQVCAVWIGAEDERGLRADLVLPAEEPPRLGSRIRDLLTEREILH